MKFNPPFKSLNEKTFFIMEEKTMKKLSRIAALLAAGALLFGAVGCSDDDGKDPESTPVTFTAADETGTLKVYGLEDGKGDFELTLGETNHKGTWTTEGVAEGKIRCAIEGVADPIEGTLGLNNGQVISVNITISGTNYTFYREGAEIPTPFTGSFVGLNAAAFGLESLASGTTNLPKGYKHILEGSEISVELYSSGEGNLRVRAGDDGKSTAINYNGGDLGDISEGKISKEPDRYIGFSAKGAGTLTVKYSATHKNADVTENKTQIAVITTEGTVLTSGAVNDDGEGSTLNVNITEAGDVAVVFSRNGTVKKSDSKGTGGMDVTEIKFTPTAE